MVSDKQKQALERVKRKNQCASHRRWKQLHGATISAPSRKPRKCVYCRKRFHPKTRGRPPMYCSPSCRQRVYEARRMAFDDPAHALRRDIAIMGARDAIERVVIDVLRKSGFLPRTSALQKLTSPRPKLVYDADEKDEEDM